jgi:hypothetical protein
MLKKTTLAIAAVFAINTFAADVPITGNVESKCTIFTDTVGIYGNPTPDVLSTSAADGGVQPRIRYDVVNADYYKAVISTPTQFSTSPTLNDTVAWTGSVSVAEVTDPLQSGYDNSKVVYDNVTEINLSVAGTVWFNVSSTATYGVNKSLPGGQYRAIVTAECIAN